MLLRCQEAPLYTTPGPQALKPNGTNSKEILFPVPPAGLGTFCSKAAALTLSVGVSKDPWSVCVWVRGNWLLTELVRGGQHSPALPRSAGDGAGGSQCHLQEQLLHQHPLCADDLCLKLYPGSGNEPEKIPSAVLLGLT